MYDCDKHDQDRAIPDSRDEDCNVPVQHRHYLFAFLLGRTTDLIAADSILRVALAVVTRGIARCGETVLIVVRYGRSRGLTYRQTCPELVRP